MSFVTVKEKCENACGTSSGFNFEFCDDADDAEYSSSSSSSFSMIAPIPLVSPAAAGLSCCVDRRLHTAPALLFHFCLPFHARGG